MPRVSRSDLRPRAPSRAAWPRSADCMPYPRYSVRPDCRRYGVTLAAPRTTSREIKPQKASNYRPASHEELP
jgi:hypothetical protein